MHKILQTGSDALDKIMSHKAVEVEALKQASTISELERQCEPTSAILLANTRCFSQILRSAMALSK